MLPLQPIYKDGHDSFRFQENKVVQYLLKNGGLDLNKLAVARELDDCKEDWEQFAQLIGYSLSGFGELSYVSDEAYEVAQAKATTGESQETVQIKRLQERLRTVHDWFKQIVPELFKVHPDDLEGS